MLRLDNTHAFLLSFIRLTHLPWSYHTHSEEVLFLWEGLLSLDWTPGLHPWAGPLGWTHGLDPGLDTGMDRRDGPPGWVSSFISNI